MITRRTLLARSGGMLTAAGLLGAPAVRAANVPLDRTRAAAHVLNRLGYGPRPGQLAEVARDPQGWIEQQLQPARIPLPAGLQDRLRGPLAIANEPVLDVLRTQVALADATHTAAKNSMADAPRGMSPEQKRAHDAFYQHGRTYQQAAAQSRVWRALESPRQLEEVMVAFWFNHFNVYQEKGFARSLTGHYEAGAIRPFALGRFRDLLGATAHHPAMLGYLDNWMSVAPRAGGQGLNENYAREVMELHTLGVDGGYTQADVTQLARMLTGWTLVPPRARVEPRGAEASSRGRYPGFWFNPNTHDGGDKTWLGRRVQPQGVEEGEMALDVLAAHPATARFVALKLARHFVADQPDPALVAHVADTFLKNDGQIVPVLHALFTHPAFWAEANVGAKFKNPTEYAYSVLRAAAVTPAEVQPVLAYLRAEAMPLFGCATPDGYKDVEAAWLNPATMERRIEFALRVARGGLGDYTDAADAQSAIAQLGPLVTPATRTVAREGGKDPALALALVLAGPGMMRR